MGNYFCFLTNQKLLTSTSNMLIYHFFIFDILWCFGFSFSDSLPELKYIYKCSILLLPSETVDDIFNSAGICDQVHLQLRREMF